MNKFLEYLNTKGHMQAKPDVKVVADKVDLPSGRAKKPPVGLGMKNGMQPYVKENGGISRGKQKGFGDSGDRSLVYDVTKSPKPASIPTAESFQHHQLFPLVRDTIKQNPALVEQLVRDLKRNGMLGILVAELSTHNETFQHLAQIMGSKNHGPDTCRKFVRAMSEDVAPPFHAPHNQMMAGDPTGADPNAMGDPNDPNGMMDPNGMPQGPPDGMDDDLDDDPDGLDDDGFDDDEFGDDPLGDEEDEDFDPNADPNLDPNADPNADPNLDPNLDPNADPNLQGQVPPMPAPMPQTLAPAMENIMRAYKQILG